MASAQYLEPKDFLFCPSAGLINYNFHLQGGYDLADELTVGGFFGFYKDREVFNNSKGDASGILKLEFNVVGIR